MRRRFAVAFAAGLLLAPLLHAQRPAPDSLVRLRQERMQAVLREIAGREQQPAESVFRNIEVLGGVPAGRLVRMMALGFAPALGVSCNHCHVETDWAADDKRPKLAAREMMRMTRAINAEWIARNEHLDPERGEGGQPPAVNCTTCHRGDVRPALDLAARPGGRPAAPNRDRLRTDSAQTPARAP
jgi:hypothetical protein